MNRLITRPLLTLTVSGLALAVVATPVKVSAAEPGQGPAAAPTSSTPWAGVQP